MKIIFYTLNRVEASEYLTTQWVHSNDNNNDTDKERRQLLWMGKLNNLSISRRPQHNFKNTDTYPKNRDLFGEPVIHTRLGKKSVIETHPLTPEFISTILCLYTPLFLRIENFARSCSTSKACGNVHQPALAESLKL